MITALILSECVYKSINDNDGEHYTQTIQAMQSFCAQFSPFLSPHLISSIQVCRRRRTGHHLLLAHSPCTTSSTSRKTMYVSCMGTKELRDIIADGSLGLQSITLPTLFLDDNDDAEIAPTTTTTTTTMMMAHGGFLSRAQSIPGESFLLHSLRNNTRLVFCGHSLGGAVAALVTLRLLCIVSSSLLQNNKNRTKQTDDDVLHCICFGTPSIGNKALSEFIQRQGWQRYFTFYLLPEDPVPGLLMVFQGRGDEAHARSRDEGQQQVVGQVLREEVGGDGDGDSALQEEEGDIDEEIKQEEQVSPAPFPFKITGLFKFPFTSVAQRYDASFGGHPLLLTPQGIVQSTISPSTILFGGGGGVGGVQQALRSHRMPAYRQRVLEILSSSEDEEDEHASQTNEILISSALAPSMVCFSIEALVPIQYHHHHHTSPSTLNRKKHGASSSSNMMRCCVVGSGLDMCTGAVLTVRQRIDGDASTDGPAARIVRSSAIHVAGVKDQVVQDIAAVLRQRQQHGNRAQLEETNTTTTTTNASSLLGALKHKFQELIPIRIRWRGWLGRSTTLSSPALSASIHPAQQTLFIDFLLPTTATTTSSSSSSSLTLYSDFEKITAPISRYRYSTAGMLAIHTLLTDSVMCALRAGEGAVQLNEDELVVYRGVLLRAMLPSNTSASAPKLSRAGSFRTTPSTENDVAKKLRDFANSILSKYGGVEGTSSSVMKPNDDDDDDDDEWWDDDFGISENLKNKKPMLKVLGYARRHRFLFHHKKKGPQQQPVVDDDDDDDGGDVDQIILLLDRDDIIRSSGTATTTATTTTSNKQQDQIELNVDVLNAVHAVIAATRKIQTHRQLSPTMILLAVNAPEAMDPLFRRRVSYASGLHGRPGAVVPVRVEHGVVRNIRMLQAAVVVHAYEKRKQLLEQQLRYRASGRGEQERISRNISVSSLFRARL